MYTLLFRFGRFTNGKLYTNSCIVNTIISAIAQNLIIHYPIFAMYYCRMYYCKIMIVGLYSYRDIIFYACYWFHKISHVFIEWK